ncbi:MAG: serine/threonine protein kinase, partial [Polyangiaceae bacterium]|nr:serine/threonine protein kinase [Polyangiaceae bacterium]
MTTTIEILRGELERLFSLEEMTSMSSRMLGLDPKTVGGATAKGSFAKALTEQCVEGDRIEALVDVILASRQEVDPRVRDVAGLLGSEEFAPGSLAGNYVIERKIAQSEFGIAYLAKKDGKAFTVKTLRREASRDRGAVHRCLTAARLVSTVKHPGLPASVDAGEFANGIFYVAYEHVENAETLASILARTGPSHLADLRPVLRAVLEPLAALHQAHLMHGDLKLEHVLVQGDVKNQPRVRLIDFGGDRLRPRIASMKGGFLAIFGSPKSIAPEQVRGLQADSRTDVYAFGTMVYELLTGKPVFQVTHPADAAFMHLSQMPEPPSARAPKGWIPPDIDEWVLSMLHKDPTGRPRDAIQLLAGLDRLGGLARSSKGVLISADKLDQLFAVFRASPEDEDTAMALEASVDQGANPNQIAEVFYTGADTVPEMEGRLDVQKSLLFRAARIFDGHSERARAEMVYARVLELD